MKHLVRSAVILSGVLMTATLCAAETAVVIPLGGIKGGVGKSGQTLCYTASGAEITCPGVGQDGEEQKGVAVSPRFTNNGNGTARDNLTGLIWLVEGNCTIFYTGDGTGKNKRSWSAALSAANRLAHGHCGLIDGSVAGDWRLPNIKELQSLVDYGALAPSFSSGHPFVHMQLQPADYYWSSTTSRNYTDSAFVVRFYEGLGTTGSKTSGVYGVLAVRGGR